MVVTREERSYMRENKLSANKSHLYEVLFVLGVMVAIILVCLWNAANA